MCLYYSTQKSHLQRIYGCIIIDAETEVAVYQEMYLGIVYLINRAPFVYSILGGLFWLFGLPRTKHQADDTQAEIA